jgi:carboxylate-amine ligase
MGDEQRVHYEELLRGARERYEAADDFTLAVEEEFAILDPSTLELTDRFDALQLMSRGTAVEDHLVGELIASEVEVRTGKADRFPEAAALMGERRGQVLELAHAEGVELAAAGTHPWSRWQDQRIIDTPHYRRNDEILRYVVWRNNSFGLHVHVAVKGADRAVRVTSALRPYMPDLLALSASSPFVENVNTGLHSARTQIFTRMFPRCGVPDTLQSWEEFEDYVRLLYGTGSVTEHTQLWWSVRSHLAFPTVEMRICDAQPDLADARSLAALIYALTARIARALDEGEPLWNPPRRLIEENLWRAIRFGLSGELIDLRTMGVRPARAAIEELIEWVMPVAEELGAAPYLNVPAQNSAEHQIARFEEGASLRDIYADLLVGQEEPVVG